MKFQIWGLTLAALAGVSSGCAKSHRHSNCEWDGSSPFCGETEHQIGDEVGEKVLAAWTKHESIEDLSDLGYCAGSYGNSCWSGYKRLWCK